MTGIGTIPRLGEMLTRSGLVGGDELERALARQAVTYLRLGELLVEAGVIEVGVLRAVLAVQEDLQFGRERDPAQIVCARIGAILADRTAIPADKLQRALEEHAKGGRSLADVLVQIGAATREQIDAARLREPRR